MSKFLSQIILNQCTHLSLDIIVELEHSKCGKVMTVITYFSNATYFRYYTVIISALEEPQLEIKMSHPVNRSECTIWIAVKRAVIRYPKLQEVNTYFRSVVK